MRVTIAAGHRVMSDGCSARAPSVLEQAQITDRGNDSRGLPLAISLESTSAWST
ncbi:MAG: hypothetical protein ACREOK_03805 [Gemmatimonadaceae bacterium]